MCVLPQVKYMYMYICTHMCLYVYACTYTPMYVRVDIFRPASAERRLLIEGGREGMGLKAQPVYGGWLRGGVIYLYSYIYIC